MSNDGESGGIMGENNNKNTNTSFAEKHPKLNMCLGLLILIGMVAFGIWFLKWLFCYLYKGISAFISMLADLASGLDAVVIVALITGSVSIVGVIISSIISKIIDYRKNRQEYLAQKREKPYGEFVDMVYKIQQNTKDPNSYTQEQMIEDLLGFSKQITLWGSPAVAKKWVKFRENGAKPDAGRENLFLMEQIMNAMRKDLGLKKVKKGNLLGFFINDIKTAFKK